MDNEEDLQSYFNSLNKDIDEGTDSMDLADAVKTVAGGDGEEVSKAAADSCSDDEATLLMDNFGNYYLCSSTEPITKRVSQSTKEIATSAPSTSSKEKKIVAKTASSTKCTTLKQDDEGDYVFVLDDAPNKSNDDTADDEVDDPKDRVYEFDENEASDDNPDDEDFVLPATKSVKLKPITSSTNAATEGEHKCTHCSYSTTKHYLLLRHLKVHSDDRPYKCSVCERGFKTNSSLQNHMNSHLGNKPHACKDCEMTFTTSGELVRHIRYRHTGEKPHKCSECDYSSVELSKLRRHIRCHTGERPYQCPHCTYASPDTFKLKRHLRTHTGEKPYECEICHARFTQSNSLKAHRLIHSVGDKPIYPCALCPTTCGRKTDLRLHVQKLHHSDHPIRCKRCNKDLPDRYSYKMHIKTHEGEKCYRCKLCPYASISARHLESHMLIHTDEKPFICTLCNIAFRQQQLLKRHNNLYHNKNYVPPEPREKSHRCPSCTRSFTHKGNLLRHMEVHDPDSNIKKQKLNLKLGRSTRLQSGNEKTFDEKLLIEQEFSEGEGEGEGDGEGEEEEEQIQEYVYEEEYENKLEDGVEMDTFTTDTFEIIEAIEEEQDDKPIVKNERNSRTKATKIKNYTIKEESTNKNIMAVDVGDDEQYMVVIQCEDDDDDDDDNGDILDIATTSIKQIVVSKNATTDIDNCFGFQEDNDVKNSEYIHSGDVKGNIQLLDIIDDM